MFRIKKMSALVLVALFGFMGYQVDAQVPQQQQTQVMGQTDQSKTDVSDKELKEFVAVYPKVQEAGQKAQEKLSDAIKASGIDMQKFRQIQMAEMQNKTDDISNDDMAAFQKAKEKVQDITPKLQKNVNNVIMSSGLSVERFQSIARAIQQDADLRKKFQTMVQG